jgi:putative salt-induced outer membrane protein YdiY
MRFQLVTVTALALAVAARPVAAQDAPPDQLITSVNLGFVNVAGNTKFTTLSGDERLEYITLDSLWRFGQSFAAVYGRNEDSTTASSFKLNGKVDRTLGSRISAFAGAGWERNRFAGISRRFEEIVGLAYQLLALERDQLRLEGGAAFNQQRSISGVSDNFVAARAAASYKHLFNETAHFLQLAEFLPNLDDGDDLRINTESALVAPLSSAIALKLSYAIRFDNLPEPGFEKTDRIFTSGIQVTF